MGFDQMTEERVNRYRGALENGEIVILEEYKTRIDVTHSKSSTREYKYGLSRFQLENGEAVNKVEENAFQIVSTGLRLTIEN